MHSLSDSDRFESASEESGEAGDFKSPIEDRQYYKDLIARANSVPIINIFKHYGLRLTEQNKKIQCPFSNRHDKGRDQSASFYYYPNTNSFWCFGCKTGTRCCDLVAALDNISRTHAATKILELYESEATDGADFDYGIDHSERLELLMDFANDVREYIANNASDVAALKYLDRVTEGFDKVYAKHKLDNAALKSLVSRAKEKIRKQCP